MYFITVFCRKWYDKIQALKLGLSFNYKLIIYYYCMPVDKFVSLLDFSASIVKTKILVLK